MSKIVIDDLNSLINKGYSTNYIKELINKVYQLSLSVKKDYPDYTNWFYSKQVPGIYDGSRNVIIIHSDVKILGFVCLKKDNIEKKICTFYVAPSFRGHKIGTLLSRLSVEWLGCDKPLITIPSDKLLSFIGIGHKYKWEVTGIEDGLYRDNGSEIIVNDFTLDNDIEENKHKIKSITGVYFFVKYRQICKYLKNKKEVNI